MGKEFTKKINKLAILGSDSFIQTINEKFILEKHKIEEIPVHKPLLIRPNLIQIQTAVMEFFKITPQKLLSRDSQNSNIPKKIALYLAVKLTQQRNSSIGQHFGNISSSAVSHAYRLIQKKLESDQSLASSILSSNVQYAPNS